VLRRATALLSLLAIGACTRHVLREADPARGVRLPADHAAHRDAQTEWWHFHAHLTDETGRRYDCFIAFIRQHTDLDRVLGIPVRWFVNPFHMAFLTVVDRQTGELHFREKHAFPDTWTARAREDSFGLRHDSWTATMPADGLFVLRASTLRARLELDLRALKPGAFPGKGGYLDVPPRSAHYYYSIPRMTAAGQLTVDGKRRTVRGLGWLKHQWGFFFSGHIAGWTWFGVQLSSGHDVEIGLIWDNDSNLAVGSFAVIEEPDGRVTPIEVRSLGVSESGAVWRSPRTNKVYPVGWVLEIPGRGTLRLRAPVEAQEIQLAFGSSWAGGLEANGLFDGRPVTGDCFGEHVQLPITRRLLRSGHPSK
jgi:predicted secreted hydrolase